MRRPLLPVLAALALGTWAGSAISLVDTTAGEHKFALDVEDTAWAWSSLLVASLAVLGWRRFAPFKSPSGSPWIDSRCQGLRVTLLVGLSLFAAMRELHLPPATGGRVVGIWKTLREGEHLIGSLEGRRPRYELPAGAVRDGEWVELFASGEPRVNAVGEVPSQGSSSFATLVTVQADEIRRLRGVRKGGWLPGRALWQDLRRGIARRISILRNKRALGLAQALMLGDRSALVPGTADLYTRTGTRHALAVSGLHVGLVASMWIWPLGALLAWVLRSLLRHPKSCGRWVRPEWLRIVMLLIFVPLAGGGAPVLRACVALCLTQVAGVLPGRSSGLWKRNVDALSIWSFAALFEWCADPAALRSISMQLSYSATLGLILMTRPVLARLRKGLPGAAQISPVSRNGRTRSPWLRAFAQKLVDWVLGACAASIAASLATLPIVWYTFGEWSLVGPIATLWLLPWLAIFLGLAWLLLVFPTDALASVLSFVAEQMEAGLRWFDSLPGTPYVLPLRPEWLLVFAGITLLTAAGSTGAWRARWGRVSLLAWSVLLLPWNSLPFPSSVRRVTDANAHELDTQRSLSGVVTHPEIYAADVGHGTAVILRLPGGGTWLFDAGSRDRVGVARHGLMPLLREMDIGELNVALSHGESDHAGALPWLIERYPPRHWLGALPDKIATRLPRTTRHTDVERGRVTLRFPGHGAQRVELALLRGLTGDGNEGSRSLEVSVGEERWLLCGDAEGPGLARQLRSGLLRGPYDLVLFPHHGSETPWLVEFLAATQPKRVWFSCTGRPPVADELDRLAIPWSSTAGAGPLRRLGKFERGIPVQNLGRAGP